MGMANQELLFQLPFSQTRIMADTGDPRIPGTLHYQTADSLNDYEEAITAIGDALASFNNTKEYPVYGFGAKYGGVVRHIFQLGPSSTVRGVEGVLKAYQSVFQSDLVMSGPTVFVQVIQAAALRARKYHVSSVVVCTAAFLTDLSLTDTCLVMIHPQETMEQCKRYCVLLIITDGMVDDIAETQRKLRVYKDLPLSIVIIGVGRADFRRMDLLCNQQGATPISFVAFRQHQHDPSSMAKAALEHLPQHVVEYMSVWHRWPPEGRKNHDLS